MSKRSQGLDVDRECNLPTLLASTWGSDALPEDTEVILGADIIYEAADVRGLVEALRPFSKKVGRTVIMGIALHGRGRMELFLEKMAEDEWHAEDADAVEIANLAAMNVTDADVAAGWNHFLLDNDQIIRICIFRSGPS